ncbi:hypothetical protein Hanom_Chr01g00046741 [Helianthus anomalus]
MINRCILQYIKNPHTYSFFIPEKELCKRNHSQNKCTGSKLRLLINIRTVLTAIANIRVHLNQNLVSSPYHAVYVQVRSIYLGSHTRNYSFT